MLIGSVYPWVCNGRMCRHSCNLMQCWLWIVVPRLEIKSWRCGPDCHLMDMVGVIVAPSHKDL